MSLSDKLNDARFGEFAPTFEVSNISEIRRAKAAEGERRKAEYIRENRSITVAFKAAIAKKKGSS